METDRRQFLARTLAVAAASAGFVPAPGRTESLALHWPHTVIQVPPQRPNDQPPVITAVAVHPSGQRIAIAGDDHGVYLWDLPSDKIVHRLQAHTDWVHSLAFSPQGDMLASGGSDHRVIFWNAVTAQKMHEFVSQAHPVTKVAWSHDGRWMAGTGFEDKLRVYDVGTRNLTRELICPCRDMRVVAFSHDDSLLAAGGRDGVVRIWKAADGEFLTDYTAHRLRIRGMAFSPDGRYLVTSGEDRQIHLRPLEAGQPGFNLPNCPAKVMSLVFYGANLLATGCSDNVIRLWDIAARSEIGKLRGHTGSVTALACHGGRLMSGSFDASVRVWTITENVAGDGGRTLPPLRTSRKPE